jgi:hypothetical protein
LKGPALCCAGASPSPYYKLGFDCFDAWCRHVASSLEELLKIGLARRVRLRGQFAPKQFVSQPDPIRIDDIALAILGDLLNTAVALMFFNFAAVHFLRFARKSHDAAALVQTRFRIWRK